MKKIICLTAAAALALCLVGCESSGTTELDRTVTTQGLTYKVSSQWTETTREDDADGFSSGYTYYTVSYENITQNNYLYVRVGYSNTDSAMEQTAASIEADVDAITEEGTYYDESTNTHYSGFEISKISDTTIDGAQCLTYKVSNTEASTENGQGYIYCYAYILAPEMHYTIEIGAYEDQTELLEEILETASIAS